MLSYTLPHACGYLSAHAAEKLRLKMSSNYFVLAHYRQLRVRIFFFRHFLLIMQLSLARYISGHSIMCENTDEKIWHHIAVRGLFFQTCRSANLVPRFEFFSKVVNSHQLPGDILLQLWSCGTSLRIDVFVVSPLQASARSSASEECGLAATSAEEKKISAKEPICQRVVWFSN